MGQEVERAAGLFEGHPEQHVEGEYDQHRDHLLDLHPVGSNRLDHQYRAPPGNNAVSSHCSINAPARSISR